MFNTRSVTPSAFCCIFCNSLLSRICVNLLFFFRTSFKNSLREVTVVNYLVLVAILECCFSDQHSIFKYAIASKHTFTSLLNIFVYIQNWNSMFRTFLEVVNNPHHYDLSHLSHQQGPWISCSCLMECLVEERYYNH